MPPILDSAAFSTSLARKLVSLPFGRPRAYSGYDAVDYRLTRFNGVTRICSIPHPKAHAALSLRIANDWGELEYVCNNPVSKVKPRQDKDGRLFIMDYGDDGVSEIEDMLISSFGRRFVVRTDISNCFNSIYSHAVPWAAVGFDEAKRNITKKSKWYNRLDEAIRRTKRNETNGIAIGPGTSAIVAEMILARVDCVVNQNFTYVRYVDDYTAYCDSMEDAEAFVLALTEELAKYKLVLNSGKTNIQSLPQSSKQDWVVDLRTALPAERKISAYRTVNYLDFVVRLANDVPNGSVLKYGFKSLIGTILRRDPYVDDLIRLVLRYTLNLCFYRPVLVPLLERLFDVFLSSGGPFEYADTLQRLLAEHGRSRRSDAITWLLYFCIKYDVKVDNSDACHIVNSEDCIPLLLLYQTGNALHQQWVVNFANKLDKSDLYKLDQYWLLLYQLFLEGKIANPYGNPKSGGAAFEVMKNEGISFIIPPSV